MFLSLPGNSMIVPKFRLLFWAGIVFLPFATLFTVMPQSAMVSGGMIVLMLILAIGDALLAFGRLAGIRVELPEVVRLSKDREGEIELRIRNERMKVRQLRIGLAFPGEIYSPNREITTRLPEENPSASLVWPCKALKQGRYTLSTYYLEAASPLGFWGMRSAVPMCVEIRVYPNLFAERKNLAALFLNKNLGIHTQRQVGKGRDFEQLREYVPGDSYEDIHWKATARQRHPITKVYQVERTQNVYLIIDASRLSARKRKKESEKRKEETSASDDMSQVSGFTSILDRFITASLIMGMAAERQGDLFGVLAFSDKMRGFVRAKNGKAHYNTCRDTLYTLEPQHVSPDFAELFTFIGTHIRRRALLIFLTNLDDPVLAEGFLHNIDLIRRRHLVLVNMLKPELAASLFSSPEIQSADDLYKNLGGHFLWSSLRETEKRLKRSGIGFSLLDNDKMAVQVVSQYLAVKQRQIL